MRFYAFIIQDGDGSYIVYYGRLFHQFVVDMSVKSERHRLIYIANNQAFLRAELLEGLMDAVNGELAHNIGNRVILPSSFIGGPPDMHRRYQDAMAIVRAYRKPDLFIAFTCNPAWPEITAALKPGQRASDCPDLMDRVFKLKVRILNADEVTRCMPDNSTQFHVSSICLLRI